MGPTAVKVPDAPEEIHEPLTAKQPAVTLMPFAKVDDAVADVTLSASVWSPAAKVDVAVPCTASVPVVVALPETVSPPA